MVAKKAQTKKSTAITPYVPDFANQTLRQVYASKLDHNLLHNAPISKSKTTIRENASTQPINIASHFLPKMKEGMDIYNCNDNCIVYVDTVSLEEAVAKAMQAKQKLWEKSKEIAEAKGKTIQPLKPMEVPILTQTCKKVLSLILEEIAKNNPHCDAENIDTANLNFDVSFTCKYFMQRCGLTDIPTASDLLDKAALVLGNIHYIYTKGYLKIIDDQENKETDIASLMLGTEDNSQLSSRTLTLFPETSYENGLFSVSLFHKYAKAVCSGFIMYLPDLYYKINPNKNPYSMNLLFYFYSLCKLKNNLKNTTFKMKTILERNGFDIEGARAARHLKRRLRDPFERDMQRLKDVLEWEYCDVKGQEISEEKLNKITMIDEYLDLNIKINIREHAMPPHKLSKTNKTIKGK